MSTSWKAALLTGLTTLTVAMLLALPSVAQAACVGGSTNGIVEAGEQCDDGNALQNDNCLNDCTTAFCGDTRTHTKGNCSTDTATQCVVQADCPSPQTCVITGGLETCDDGNQDSGDGCSDVCIIEFCGDLVVNNTSETCDPPYTSGGDVGCSNSCVDVCGNGVIQAGVGEVCDSGNTGGATCVTQGFTQGAIACAADCSALDLSDCTTCGDGVIEGPEECDPPFDGTPATLGCNANCEIRVCGDGVTNASAGEQCDDGNTTAGDGCNATCQDEFCGDLIVNDTTETCDPPFGSGGAPGCNGSCTDVCGNGVLNAGQGEVCDDADFGGATCATLGFTTGTLSCSSGCDAIDDSACTTCGDGVTEGAETCDPPFSSGGAPGCNGSCSDLCGNGSINGGSGEVCDGTNVGAATCATQGYTAGDLGCASDCSAFDESACTTCGDGVVEGTEGCDPPFSQGGNIGCNNSCVATECGDGVLNAGAGEQCDDGNTDNNDGCSFNCQNEICGDEIVQTSEDCDPPYTSGGDIGCGAGCAQNCGNGTLQAGVGEVCDTSDFGGATCASLGDFNNGDLACSSDCGTIDTSGCGKCGDGVVDAAETCDPPFSQGGDPGCNNSCQDLCGNNNQQASVGEACDGTDLDSKTCADFLDESSAAFDGGVLACSATCGEFDTSGCTRCGDGATEGTETCDPPFDGTLATVGCNSLCEAKICGDGVTNTGAGEECDDGNTDNNDGCNSQCQDEECGDGIVQDGIGEECDPPFTLGGAPGCNGSCQNVCDGGGLNAGAGEVCDGAFLGAVATCADIDAAFDIGTPGCLSDCSGYDTSACGTCGDGTINALAGEQCDPPYDAMTDQNRGCNASCQVTVCGDGVVNTGGGEQCDDGTSICTSLGESNGQECSSKAGAQACAANAGVCSPGNSDVTPDACRSTCRDPWCGDGVADPSNSEFCDDGLLSGSTDPADASVADDTDNCPNGPNTKAQGAECVLRNVCGDGIPKFIDSSARTDEDAATLGFLGCSSYTAAGAEQCDNGNLGGGGPYVSTCTGAGDTLLPGLARCENNLLIACVVDANCILGGMDFGPCGNSDTRADACRNATCMDASCGDDVVDAGETCDDGAAVCVGGSDAGQPCGQDSTACVTGGGTCRHEANGADGSTLVCNAAGRCNTDEVGDACRDNCGLPTCGDGTVDAGEGCDDGIANAASATCTDTCAVAICGDTKVCEDVGCNTAGLGPEECDDGNANPNDGCRNNCTANVCGDSIVNIGVEQCDDGNAAIGDGCSPACCKDATSAGGLSEHYDAEECGIGEGASITSTIDPMGNNRIARLIDKLNKRWTKQLDKQTATEARSPEYRQCAGLRGLERKVDRSMRRIIDKSWVRGELTDAERDSLTAVIDTLVELYKSSRALIIGSSPSGKC